MVFLYVYCVSVLRIHKLVFPRLLGWVTVHRGCNVGPRNENYQRAKFKYSEQIARQALKMSAMHYLVAFAGLGTFAAAAGIFLLVRRIDSVRGEVIVVV